MKNFYRKKYIDLILNKIDNEKLFLLVGARQVGKTTIMEILKEKLEEKLEEKYKTLYFNFEDFFGIDFKTKNEFVDFFKFEYNFDFYEEGIIFLDEIQYLKNPESILKSLYDDKNIKIKIISTGSRFWGQKKVGSSLVGRGEIIKIYPFDFFEFLEFKGKNTDIFNVIENYRENNFILIEQLLEEYQTFGGYPAVIKVNSKQEKINETKKIIDRFFEKDFSYFLKTNDFVDFKKVFQYISLNIKNIIKIDAISNDLGISRYKIEQFLQFLKDSYLIYEVKPYFTDKSKEYNQNSEIYFNDLGILNYISGNNNIGNINENFVFLEILKMIQDKNIYYYKKKNGSEIDFIVENDSKKLFAIEIKSSNKDIIPKILDSFYLDYKDKIECFLVTTKSMYKVREIEDKKVLFLPNFLVGKVKF